MRVEGLLEVADELVDGQEQRKKEKGKREKCGRLILNKKDGGDAEEEVEKHVEALLAEHVGDREQRKK